MKALKEKDRVISPDGIGGTVLEAEVNFGEFLVALDTGQRIWYYQEELTMAPEGPQEVQDGRNDPK